jgi:signal transduction histidine kinase
MLSLDWVRFATRSARIHGAEDIPRCRTRAPSWRKRALVRLHPPRVTSARRGGGTGVTDPIRHQREVLRQAAMALQGRVVTLWEVSPDRLVAPLTTTGTTPPDHAAQLDLDATLRGWGAPILVGSRWVGCRLDNGGRWCVAPVRSRPAEPPPGGIERRRPGRLILELAGLCVGVIDATAGEGKRIPPGEAAWEHARQPSVIAHEVGNQLAVASGNIDFGIAAVRAAPALDLAFRTRLLEDLTNAAQGIEQATDYLRSIQDRSRLEVGRVSRFDSTAVVRSCVTLEQPLARKRGVALSWASAVESAYLVGDPNALYQVVTNLIRNAVDASQAHQGTVLVRLERTDEILRLSVRDRGEGIAREHLSQIFAPGFTTKPGGSGSGTGLAVVREITEHMYGGTVRVESELGKGSTFTLVLPIPPQRSGA